MTRPAINLDSIRRAARRLDGVIHHTPVATCAALDRLAGRELLLKCENLQKVGAFKFRGASNAILSLDEAAAAQGVVTHSSGNHAQAVALAARNRGTPSWIVMPRTALLVKRQAVEGYGGTVRECEPTLLSREETAARVQEETGATFIHAYDNPKVIAGQGTAALELLAQAPDLDALIAPVGGGGLLSGSCIAARGLAPQIRIFAAEPLGADDCARSMARGELIPQTAPDTIADGLLTSLGLLTWPIIREHVERVLTVTDEEIVSAMRLVWERAKLVIEPSAAVAVAAALTDELRGLDGIRRVGVLLSGGNVDLDRLPWS